MLILCPPINLSFNKLAISSHNSFETSAVTPSIKLGEAHGYFNVKLCSLDTQLPVLEQQSVRWGEEIPPHDTGEAWEYGSTTSPC
jgi:hypothetical protein